MTKLNVIHLFKKKRYLKTIVVPQQLHDGNLLLVC